MSTKTRIFTLICRSALICPLLAPPAPAQSLISQIGWKGAGTGIIIGLAVFFGTGLGLLLSFYIGLNRKRAMDRRDASAKLFDEESERCKLTAEEALTLRSVAGCAPGSAKPHEIFHSIALFERCIDVYVNRAVRSQPQQAEGQEGVLQSLRQKLGFTLLPPEQPLVSTRNLCVGQKVSVYPPGQTTHPKGGEVSFVGEVFFTVRVVDDFRDGLVFADGAEFTIAFLRQGDAAYSVSAKVHKSFGSGEICFFHTTKFLRNQNRRYMRLEIVLPLRYRVVEKANPREKPPEEAYTARSADISGGGMCFIAADPLTAGDMISLTVHLPDLSLKNIKSKILRVIPVEGKEPAQYKHLLQFISIEPPQRERIVKFIFEKQREAIQMR